MSEFMRKDVHQLICTCLISRPANLVAVLIAPVVDAEKIQQGPVIVDVVGVGRGVP
jgi:hypothetical protein